MTLVEILTIAGIVIGPLAAVLIAQHLQNRKEKRERRMNVFRTLMRTRRTPMTLEHVGALNLIEIEFADKKQIIDAWRRLFEHLGTMHNRYPGEVYIDGDTLEQKNYKDDLFWRRINNERHTLLAKTLHSMAREMGFKIEQLEIFEGGYTPQGWEDEQLEARIVRKSFIDLLHGRRLLPVVLIGGENDSSGVDEQTQ
ncbi:hypothetical protein GGD81_002046 [Rhodobium orientis]|nr:DUF6680 family protein [Rhodobium orientis]MBB4303008.1 hypothetical protein [Rhodobium orientis]